MNSTDVDKVKAELLAGLSIQARAAYDRGEGNLARRKQRKTTKHNNRLKQLERNEAIVRRWRWETKPTAHHEAGHLTVAKALGLSTSGAKHLASGDGETLVMMRGDKVKRAAVVVAGGLAEAKHNRQSEDRWIDHASDRDLEVLHKLKLTAGQLARAQALASKTLRTHGKEFYTAVYRLLHHGETN